MHKQNVSTVLKTFPHCSWYVQFTLYFLLQKSSILIVRNVTCCYLQLSFYMFCKSCWKKFLGLSNVFFFGGGGGGSRGIQIGIWRLDFDMF